MGAAMPYVFSARDPEQDVLLPNLVQAADPGVLSSLKGLVAGVETHLHTVLRVFFHVGLVHLLERFPDLEALNLAAQKTASGGWEHGYSLKRYVCGMAFRPGTTNVDVHRDRVTKAFDKLRKGIPQSGEFVRAVLGPGQTIDRLSADNAVAYLAQIGPEGGWVAGQYEARRLNALLDPTPATAPRRSAARRL